MVNLVQTPDLSTLIQFINRIILVDSENVKNQSEKRNIKLSNFTSLVMAGALCFIALFRVTTSKDHGFYLPLLPEAVFFSGLTWLNRVGDYTLSRILVCWAPPIFLLIDFPIRILQLPVPETSRFLGFRIFQVAFSVSPFLVVNISEIKKFLFGLFVSILIVLGYDKLVNLIGVGYYELGLADTSYPFEKNSS